MKNLLVPLAVVAVLISSPPTALAQSEFAANLSGDNEVPPVPTTAFGNATFDVNFAAGVLGISYELSVVNMKGAFMGHIHCGAAGVNGPIVAWLAGQPAAPAGYELNGVWVRARMTAENFIAGSPCGNTFVDLIVAMANGQTYVNVHTRTNTGGEIRGQIVPVAPFTVP
jgi:hypothetical protein